MPRRRPRLRTLAGVLPAVLASCACAGSLDAATASASPPTKSAYLGLAEQGMNQQSGHWRTAAHGWYCEVLRCTGAYPLLTIWGVVRMFEAADAVQMAQPTSAHRSKVEWFASQAESLYWNHYLHGYDPYPGDD